MPAGLFPAYRFPSIDTTLSLLLAVNGDICTPLGQPPADLSRPSWEVFNAAIHDRLEADTVAAFAETYKPNATDYNEHALNVLTAQALHQVNAWE